MTPQTRPHKADFKVGVKPLLGIIGGLSYHSTLMYYQKINQGFAELFGKERSAPLLLYSHDFGLISEAQKHGNWRDVRQNILKSARILKNGGCQDILIASNTIHKLVAAIKQETGLRVLHIADAVGRVLQQHAYKRIGLMAT